MESSNPFCISLILGKNGMISQDSYSGVDKKKGGQFSMTSWKSLDLYPIKH